MTNTGPEKMTHEAVSQRLTAAAADIEIAVKSKDPAAIERARADHRRWIDGTGWTKEEFFAESKRRVGTAIAKR